MKNNKDKENFFKRFTDLILFLSLGLLFFVLEIIGLLNKQDYKIICKDNKIKIIVNILD